MPNPKRRHSNTMTRKRRTHDSLKMGNGSLCPQCKKEKLPHRICPYCGFYKGKPVIQKVTEEKSK